jgi:thymidylate kinase
MKNLGKLLIFEGPNSVGKTSLSRRLAEHYTTQGEDCLLLSFPGHIDGTIGSLIYRLHHSPSDLGITSISPSALQIMHVAAHVDAIESQIIPALKDGKTVILDRFWWSTIIYGQLNGLPRRFLNSIVQPEIAVWGEIKPSAIFLMTRDTPFEFPTTPEWAKCSQLYSDFASEEPCTENLYPISNATSFNATLAIILERIAEI